MNILVDENIPLITVAELRKIGHHVTDIRGTEKEGISDQEVWQIAQKQNLLVISTDKGFSIHRDDKHQGIIIVCLKQPNRKKIHSRVMLALAQYPEEAWKGLMIIIKDNSQSIWRSSGESLF